MHKTIIGGSSAESKPKSKSESEFINIIYDELFNGREDVDKELNAAVDFTADNSKLKNLEKWLNNYEFEYKKKTVKSLDIKKVI